MWRTCVWYWCALPVHLLPIQFSFIEGEYRKATTQRSELVDTAQHRKGSQWSHSIQCFTGCAQCQSRKDAAAKEAATAAQAAPLSYASRPLYVAKIAHAINKQEGTDVCNQQDVPSVGPSC